jgi:hypothetical protein
MDSLLYRRAEKQAAQIEEDICTLRQTIRKKTDRQTCRTSRLVERETGREKFTEDGQKTKKHKARMTCVRDI